MIAFPIDSVPAILVKGTGLQAGKDAEDFTAFQGEIQLPIGNAFQGQIPPGAPSPLKAYMETASPARWPHQQGPLDSPGERSRRPE